MKHLGLAAAVATAAGFGIAAATGAFGDNPHPRVVPGAPPPPSAAELRVLGRLALDAARGAGDAHPTGAVVVATTRRIAEQVDAGDPSEADTPAYFVLLHGDFTARDASVPSGAKAPTGQVLTLTIDPRTNVSTDGGVEDRMPDLDAIGQPEPLPLPPGR